MFVIDNARFLNQIVYGPILAIYYQVYKKQRMVNLFLVFIVKLKNHYNNTFLTKFIFFKTKD